PSMCKKGELAKLMPRYTGYDGADSEAVLIAALKEDFDGEETDAIQKIKTKYMRDGHIIDIAVARGYTKKLGFRGWVYTAIGKGETYARECLTCWKGHACFDDAVNWYRTGNTGFVPSKLSGPRFGAELLKAYGERLLTDADKLAR